MLNKSRLRSGVHPAPCASTLPAAGTAPALPCATPISLPQGIVGQFGVIYTRNHSPGDIWGETVPGMAPSTLCSPWVRCSPERPYKPPCHARSTQDIRALSFTLWPAQCIPCRIPDNWAERNRQRIWWLDFTRPPQTPNGAQGMCRGCDGASAEGRSPCGVAVQLLPCALGAGCTRLCLTALLDTSSQLGLRLLSPSLSSFK